VEKTIINAARIPSRHSMIFLIHIGGALNQLDEDYSPVGNRNAHFVYLILSSWENKVDDPLNIEWARSAWNDARSFSTGGTYLNFLSQDEGQDRVNAALGSGLLRLAQIKKRWDPENVFRTNRNIKPSG
jgi:hypothetical protein